jgi:hypothetical protein
MGGSSGNVPFAQLLTFLNLLFRIGWAGEKKFHASSELEIDITSAAVVFFTFQTSNLNSFVYEQTVLDLVAQFTDCAVVDVAIKQYTINTVLPRLNFLALHI